MSFEVGQRIIDPVMLAKINGEIPPPAPPSVTLDREVVNKILDVLQANKPAHELPVELRHLIDQIETSIEVEDYLGQLWALYSHGPGDCHPMLSKEAAEKEAADATESCKRVLEREGLDLSYVRFEVIPSPFSAAEHWEMLANELAEQRDAVIAENEELKAKLNGDANG